jgi:hypothetical protein
MKTRQKVFERLQECTNGVGVEKKFLLAGSSLEFFEIIAVAGESRSLQGIYNTIQLRFVSQED